ncbi:MAG: hypothetical protein J5379_05060 [Clostridiales bacterium]|nr:hypothetical protein [Clostridiales bacterium]
MSNNSVTKKIMRAKRTSKLIGAIACFIFVLLIAVGLLPEHTKYYLARENIFAIPTNDYKIDKYYRGKTYSLYDWFAENSEGKFYLAPVENEDGQAAYLIVYIPNKYERKAEDIMQQTYRYLDSEDESELKESINCRGYVTEVNAKTSQYLNEYFDMGNVPQSVRNSVCNKMFVMVPLSKVVLSESSFFVLLELILLVAGIFLLLSMFSKKGLNPLKERLSRESMSLEDLDSEFDPPVLNIGNFYVSDKHVLDASMNPRVITIADIVWIYPHKQNQVNSAPIYNSVFMTRHHECLKFAFKEQSQSELFCKAVHDRHPEALYGYVIENTNLYYKHFNELIDQVYNQEKEVPQDAPADEPTENEGSDEV